ncbi:MAG: helix-turn-helix transcriptional regulator, partial [Bacteroidota bacterium]
HLHHRLTVTDLSKEAYMSESHFHRSFKNQIGMSPIEFINQERLHMAAALLTEGGHRLTDISMRCGFNSSSYFSKMFKRYYGVSPLKWDGAQGAA